MKLLIFAYFICVLLIIIPYTLAKWTGNSNIALLVQTPIEMTAKHFKRNERK